MASDDKVEGPVIGINVTPLVDITLVLLIVFMVTARIINQRQSLEVDLPRAATGRTVQELVSLVLPATGALEIDGEKLARDDDLLARVRAASRRDKDLRAVIQADTAVPHGRVMRVMDLLRQGGVSRIGFGVIPTPATPEP